ncbi:MAG: hypothetical protein M1814_006273 [Vezdaea aestivalis]|nr:MAG: hypothetical protein M1814_006273 [Vezdaea aestivalis]
MPSQSFLKILTVSLAGVVPINFNPALLPNTTSSAPGSWGTYSIGGPFNTSASNLRVTYYRRNAVLPGSPQTYTSIYAPYFANTSTEDPKGRTGPEAPQPPIIQISSTSTASCISYIGFIGAQGEQGGWLGDMGRACDQDWYFSNDVVGTDALSGFPYKPDCTWIDLSHKGNTRITGFQAALDEFLVNTPTIWKTKQSLCDFPAMVFQNLNVPPGFWNDTSLGTGPASGPGRRKRYCFQEGFLLLTSLDANASASRDHIKRAEKARLRQRQQIQQEMDERLIVTDNPLHSMSQLCNSSTSLGPNMFNSQEGRFCHMASKQVYNICKSADEQWCFDADARQLRNVLPMGIGLEKTTFWNGAS